MKTEQFLSLLKKGQKVFKDIDLEGNFVNEDLSNLTFVNCFIIADFSGANLSKTTFERCNLKTCIFDYSCIDQSIFIGNILDDAEFQFVQYNDLTLIENTYYACDFTNEVLEGIRYANYPGFHIIKVYAGWFEIVLVNKSKSIIITASDYLGNDAPYELLKALCDMCEDDIEHRKAEWLCWDEEPGAFIWKLIRNKNDIKISVYTAKRDSYEIDRTGRASLENEELFCTDIEAEGNFLGFIKAVDKSFEKIKESMCVENYETEWAPFPHMELKRLKKLISVFSKQIRT